MYVTSHSEKFTSYDLSQTAGQLETFLDGPLSADVMFSLLNITKLKLNHKKI